MLFDFQIEVIDGLNVVIVDFIDVLQRDERILRGDFAFSLMALFIGDHIAMNAFFLFLNRLLLNLFRAGFRFDFFDFGFSIHFFHR